MKNERVIYFKHSLHQLLYLSIILLYNKNTHTQNWLEEIVLRVSLEAHNSSKRLMHVFRYCESKKVLPWRSKSLTEYKKSYCFMLWRRKEILFNIGNSFKELIVFLWFNINSCLQLTKWSCA